MAAPNDTSTTLNAGTGGDVMDESLVLQYDGITEVKRPRVVPGSDDGDLQSFYNSAGVIEAHVRDASLLNVMESMLQEQSRCRVLLHMLINETSSAPTLDDVDAMVHA